MNRIGSVVLVAAMMAGCVDGKEEVDEDFSDLAGQDDKSDYFSYRLKLLGTVGDGWKNTWYTSTPRFRGWIFYADPGDEITVRLWSYSRDPVTWILDTDFNVLASNDDAGEDTYDSFIRLTIPSPGSRDRRYLVVFRDYDLRAGRFYLDYTWKKGTPPDSWEQRVREWFTGEVLRPLRWEIPGWEYVIEPDAFPYTERALAFEQRTDGPDQPWLYEVDGREGFALVSGWDDRFFADLYDVDMQWFAHAWGILDPSTERVTHLDWSADDNDPTICVCEEGEGAATCTWLDGSTFSSGSIPCE